MTGTLPSDFFSDAGAPQDKHNKDKVYWAVVYFLWRKVSETFVKTEESIRDLTTAIGDRERQHQYNLIYGDVQSGKSRSIMLVSWYCCFILRNKCPVVLTINLDSVRTDFMKKASFNGELNSLIAKTISSIEFKDTITPLLTETQSETLRQCGGFTGGAFSEWFSLKPKEFHHIATNGDANKDGVLPVLLQNPSNLKELVKYHQTQSHHDKSLVVIVDEIHKMYTEPMNKRSDGMTRTTGVKKKREKNPVNCMSMMYWLQEKCRQLKLHLVGVTATPARAATDIHVYPDNIFKLQSDPVVVGGTALHYYGTFDQEAPHHIITESFGDEDIEVDFDIDLAVETVRSIVLRPHCEYTIADQQYRAVKTVLITVGRLQETHMSIKKALESDPELGDLVEAFVVNSDHSGASHKLVDVFSHLEVRPSDKMEATKRRRVLTRGAVVIIGHGCFAAGISVKPMGYQKIECRIKEPQPTVDAPHNIQCYRLFGLTDQIYMAKNRQGPKTLEQNIQAMRLFGYYPEDYEVRLWSSECDLEVIKDQLAMNRQLVAKYQNNPTSIESLIFDPKIETYQLFEKDPYRACRAAFPIEKVKTKPKSDSVSGSVSVSTLTEIKNRIYPIGEWMKASGQLESFYNKGLMCLSDFFGKEKTKETAKRELRQAVRKEFSDTTPVSAQGKHALTDEEREIGIQRLKVRFEILYSEARCREILRTVVHPNEQNTQQVNSYLTGDKGETTPLDETFLVVFDHEWNHEKRKTQDDLSYFFQDTPTTWVVVHSKDTSIKEHSMLNFMTNNETELNDEHHNILEKIDEKSGRGKFQYGWNLFIQVYRSLYGKQNKSEYSAKWRSLFDEQRKQFSAWIGSYDDNKDTVHAIAKQWLDDDFTIETNDTEIEHTSILVADIEIIDDTETFDVVMSDIEIDS